MSGHLKDSHSSPEKKYSCASKFCLYVLIVIAFYAVLAVILALSNNTAVNDVEKEDDSDFNSTDTCSAKSYLLGDGVCDEVTNYESCFFDGGDCCLDFYRKDTKFCQDCSCLGVFGRNYSSFIEDTKIALTVFELVSPEGFQNLYTVHKLIQEVRSAEVCSLLCTEEETLTMTSGWLHISLNNVCNCIVVNEQLCGDEIGTVLTQQQILNMDAFQNSTLLFVNSSSVNIRTNCRDNILVITGHPHNLSNVSEIVTYSRNKGNWDCEGVPSLPKNLGGSTGARFDDGTVIVCGGYEGFLSNFESTCYLNHPGEKEWTERKLTVSRYFAASVVVNGISLVVSGGYQRTDTSSFKILNTIEIIHQKSFPEVFQTPMPFELADHCLVKLNSSLTFLAIGGRKGFSAAFNDITHGQQHLVYKNVGNLSDQAFMYSESSDTWSNGPRLSVPREGHSCGTLTDPESGALIIAVAGGFNSDSKSDPALDSVETLIIQQGDDVFKTQWKAGPTLVHPLSYSAMVTVDSGSKLLLLGGSGLGQYSQSIIELTCSSVSEGCQQRLLDIKLSFPRSGFVAILVDNVNCKRADRNKTDPEFLHYTDSRQCDNRPVDFKIYETLTRTLCCHGGNLCEKNNGACFRDEDCLGNLVCGCRNCDRYTEGVENYFSTGDNCCTEPIHAFCSNVSDHGFQIDSVTTNRNPANPESYCLSNDDCPSGQLCIGDCTIHGAHNELEWRTCCVTVSIPEHNDCCNGSLTLSIQDVRCPDYDTGGTFVQFAPSPTSPSWTYIQLGNYNAMLMLETMLPYKRHCHSTVKGICGQYGEVDDSIFSFRPPGWTILQSPTDSRVEKGNLFHVSYTNDMNSTCPGHFEGLRQSWTCYSYALNEFRWLLASPFHEFAAGTGTLRCLN